MRLAILADIHGNDHALAAVLDDIAAQGVDEIVVNGDMVNRGPNNVAVLERLAPLGATWLLGNHDDLLRKWIERDPDVPRGWYDDPFWASTAWAARQIDEAGWLPALRDLPMARRIAPPGAPPLLITHGSPRHYREGYGRQLADESYAEIAENHDAALFVGSHTHRPLEHVVAGRTFLNSGAVGAPFNGNPDAQYLLLTLRDGAWSWAFRSVPYDRAAAIAACEESGFLAEGGVSARIFFEELRRARPIYPRFWLWSEERGGARDWAAWERFWGDIAGTL